MLKITGAKDIEAYTKFRRKQLPYGRGIVITSGIAYEVLFNHVYETIARRLGQQPGERVEYEKESYEAKNYLYRDSTSPATNPNTLIACVNVLVSFFAGENIDGYFQ